MVRKKKEMLVHLDLETLSKETTKKTGKTVEEKDTSLGGILRKAREKKKLQIAQIAKKLCIRDIYLEALENGHYYAFPGLAYGVGFLRTYARFLDLDAEEMVEKFQAETSSIPEEPLEMPMPQNANLMPSGRTIFKGLATLIILYLLWYIVGSLTHTEKIDTPEILPSTVLEEGQLNGQTAVVPAMQETSDVQIKEALSAQDNDQPAEVSEIVQTQINQEVPVPVVVDAAPKMSAPVQMKKSGFGSKLWSKLTPAKVYGAEKVGALSFVATEEVWVKIMQDDKVVLEEVLYKGDRYNVPANTSYTLTTANAGALTVYVNGKKKKALGTKGSLEENVVLNPQNFN